MSRKPTAVSLGKKTEAPKANAHTSPRDAGKKHDKPRKPRAMEAPRAEEAEDFLEQDSGVQQMPADRVIPTAKGSRWPTLLATSVLALATLGIGLWFTQLVETLFARQSWLGWIAAGLLALAILSLTAILIGELLALWRLRKLGRIREDVMRATQDRTQPAKPVLLSIVGLYEKRDDMQWHLAGLAAHEADIMDDRDRLLLAERYLMKPLDLEAQRIISTAAKRNSVITAVNPATSLDILFTGYQILSMLRQVMALYGNRPGVAGTLKLAGMVGSHLAVTGGLALSDTLVQQFLGKGLAGKLSAKLGEGVVNGILTARIGIAAIDLCRPMPFHDLERPGLKRFIAMLAGTGAPEKGPEK